MFFQNDSGLWSLHGHDFIIAQKAKTENKSWNLNEKNYQIIRWSSGQGAFSGLVMSVNLYVTFLLLCSGHFPPNWLSSCYTFSNSKILYLAVIFFFMKILLVFDSLFLCLYLSKVKHYLSANVQSCSVCLYLSCRRNTTLPLWNSLFISNDCGLLPGQNGAFHPTLSQTSGSYIMLIWIIIIRSQVEAYFLNIRWSSFIFSSYCCQINFFCFV